MPQGRQTLATGSREGHTFTQTISLSPHSHMGERGPWARLAAVFLGVLPAGQPAVDHGAEASGCGTDVFGSHTTSLSAS